jgi:hypothetical protein
VSVPLSCSSERGDFRGSKRRRRYDQCPYLTLPGEKDVCARIGDTKFGLQRGDGETEKAPKFVLVAGGIPARHREDAVRVRACRKCSQPSTVYSPFSDKVKSPAPVEAQVSTRLIWIRSNASTSLPPRRYLYNVARYAGLWVQAATVPTCKGILPGGKRRRCGNMYSTL